jgi:endoglucanase
MLRTRREINCLFLSSIPAVSGVTAGRPTTVGLRYGEGPISPEEGSTASGASRAPVKFFINPNSGAAKWLKENAGSPDAKYMQMIADNMHAIWLGSWNRRIAAAATNMLKQHAAQGALPVFVLYNIPGRDNGGYSAGGEGSPEAYYEWISGFASALGDSEAIVILEPDALALSIEITEEQNRAMRYTLVNTALDILKKQPKAKVYLDAGHPGWRPADEMAGLLAKGGVGRADGFFVNVSNFPQWQGRARQSRRVLQSQRGRAGPFPNRRDRRAALRRALVGQGPGRVGRPLQWWPRCRPILARIRHRPCQECVRGDPAA